MIQCLVEETEAHVIVGFLLHTQSEFAVSTTSRRRPTFSSSFFSSAFSSSAAAAPPAAAPPEDATAAPPDGTDESLAEPSAINYRSIRNALAHTHHTRSVARGNAQC